MLYFIIMVQRLDQINISVERKIKEDLKELSIRRDMSIAQIVRRAIRKELENESRTKPKEQTTMA